MKNQALKKLLQSNPAIWCASEAFGNQSMGMPTGFEALNDLLPANGWPKSSLVEVILPCWGSGELQLLLPTLIALSQQQQWIVWIAPPYIPYAPALTQAGVNIERLMVIPADKIKNESLWVMEKILRNRSCGLAMVWPQRVSDKAMRRLQLAAEEGQTLGFLFRDYRVHSSPAALRISVSIVGQQLQVSLLKARGASRYSRVLLDLPVV